MPSLALSVNATYPTALKRDFARRLGSVYAETMQTRLETITVAVHDGREGTVWRCAPDGDPTPSALLMCDVRRGRPVAQRAALSRAMIAVCEEVLAIDPATIKIEFTQHDGDEMFHPQLGGFNRDWDADEPT